MKRKLTGSGNKDKETQKHDAEEFLSRQMLKPSDPAAEASADAAKIVGDRASQIGEVLRRKLKQNA